MNQIRDRNEIKPRLFDIAHFFGKTSTDPKLIELIDTYLQKVQTIPMPAKNPSPTQDLLKMYDELEIDPDILEDGWWRYNSYYVAHHSVFGHTKNEWKNLVEYITNG